MLYHMLITTKKAYLFCDKIIKFLLSNGINGVFWNCEKEKLLEIHSFIIYLSPNILISFNDYVWVGHEIIFKKSASLPNWIN